MLETLLAFDADAFGEILDLAPTAIYRTDARGLNTYFYPSAARLAVTRPVC